MYDNDLDFLLMPSKLDELVEQIRGTGDQLRITLEGILGPIENIKSFEELKTNLGFLNTADKLVKELIGDIPDLMDQIGIPDLKNIKVKIPETTSIESVSLNSSNDRKILLISIIFLSSCTSYNEILLKKIFQFLIESAVSLYITSIIATFAFALFPDSSDKILKLLEELTKK